VESASRNRLKSPKPALLIKISIFTFSFLGLLLAIYFSLCNVACMGN
jgi:hypothetical protein